MRQNSIHSKAKYSYINSTPETFKSSEIIPNSQKLKKPNTKFHHKRSPTNWRELVNREIDQMYNGIVVKNITSSLQQRYKTQMHQTKHQKSIYQRFQQIMETSQIFNARKNHQRQTTGLTDKKQSLWDSPKKKNNDENKNNIYACEKKLEELMKRNKKLKQSLAQLKQSILVKFNLVQIVE